MTFIFIQVKRQSNEADPTKAGTTVLDTQCSHSVLDLCSGRIRSIRLKLRGTSKFSGAEELLVEAVRCQELSVRKVLAYGTKHGLGVFCMLLSGEKQIGWIPETRKSEVEQLLQLPRFRAKLENVASEMRSERFHKIIIEIVCETGSGY